MKLRKTLSKLALGLCATSLLALNSMAAETNFEELMAVAPKMEKSVRLNVKSLNAIQLDNGEIIYVSDNGRFALQGRIVDVWSKNELDTMDEIEFASTHVELDKFNLDLSTLNTFTFGEGEKEVVVFADPFCDYCKKYISDVYEAKDSRYKYTVVVVPALGEKSNLASRSMFCASNPEDRLKNFLKGSLESMIQKANCDTQNYDMTLTFAHMMGIQAVPHFIAPDGRYRTGGLTKDVNNWLAAN